MTSHSRSKSCNSSFFRYSSSSTNPQNGVVHDDVIDDICYYCQDYYNDNDNNNNNSNGYTPITTPFISPRQQNQSPSSHSPSTHGFTVVSILLTALRKSLLTCTVNGSDDVSASLDIGCPTDVRHVAHVTFDRFNGFLGLPLSLQSDVPRRVPSASVCVFGVSVESMQCSYDSRGNSVPTILLTMQKRLYAAGGLQAEGIFRINGENGQEEYIRKQLNKGFVPHGVDIHCLAGLIKAWFRELPRGVLDSLTPEQVLHCNTEDECARLVKSLPPTEAALLDWAINLMADVVKYDRVNKMNARNIAMVFAPNMTQMADPLTALIHAVQIMNLLKTLVLKTLRKREESSPGFKPIYTCEEKPEYHSPLRTATLERLGSENEEQFWSFPRKSGSIMEYDYMSSNNSPASGRNSVDRSKEEPEVNIEGILEKLSLRKGVRRLCRHPVFQLSKPAKKTGTAVVDARDGDVAWS